MSRLDQLRVDLLLQYTLVRAAQEDDWRDRVDDWLAVARDRHIPDGLCAADDPRGVREAAVVEA